MNWATIDTAPKTGVFMDLWANGFRYPDCFWSEKHQSWIRQVKFVQKNGSQGLIYNKVENPTHHLIVTAP